MKIEINTSARNVEIANFLLAEAIKSCSTNPKYMDYVKINQKDLIAAEKFRKSLIKGFIKS